MCYDLAEYDPFEPLWIYANDYFSGELEIDSKPMNDDDWQEWLEGGNDETYCD